MAFNKTERTAAESLIEVTDVKTGRLLMKLGPTAGRTSSISYSADGRRLISGSSDTTIMVWDVSRVR